MVKENEFGTPFSLVEVDREGDHLDALMCNFQAYIEWQVAQVRRESKDFTFTKADAANLARLHDALFALRKARKAVSEAMSGRPVT